MIIGGTYFAWWFLGPVALVLLIAAILIPVGVRSARRETAARIEAERIYDGGKPAAAAQARQASQDDLYPAQPEIRGPQGPLRQAVAARDSGAAGPDAVRTDGPAAADLAARTHELAALTQGETVTEEIERLEARLSVLYDLLGKAAAADVAASEHDVAVLLESGAFAHAWWLEEAA